MNKKEIKTIKTCRYCGSPVHFRDSSIIYKKSYGQVYICSKYPACDAYVGVHRGSDTPLGILANAELREARNEAHRAFDPLWKEKGMSRKEAYRLLQERLNLREEEAHIAEMDIDMCLQVVKEFT